MALVLGQNRDDHEKIAAALEDIQQSLGVIDNDLAAIDAATQVQVRGMLKRLMLIERAALRRERVIVRQLARILARIDGQ